MEVGATRQTRAAQEYGGVRVELACFLGKARIPLQVDIGYGDAITPAPETQASPTLLPMPAPQLRMYPLETVVAEKFEAIVRLGLGNSRMKDFRDLLTLSQRRDFDGPLLSRSCQTVPGRDQAHCTLDCTLAPAPTRDRAETAPGPPNSGIQGGGR